MLETLNTGVLVLAQEEGGAAADEGGNFLVTPDVGLMIWTLIAFLVTLYVLGKVAFPRVQEALDKRQKAIEESLEESERTRAEAQKILQEYRERLQEARSQAEEIVVRARRAAEEHEREALEGAREQREELLEQTRRDIEAETRRAIQDIRNEVADLTILATEKVTRKVLSPEDQQKLVQEALQDLDFEALTQQNGGATR
jgi:F-type H+-transporting ATPase subunit b